MNKKKQKKERPVGGELLRWMLFSFLLTGSIFLVNFSYTEFVLKEKLQYRQDLLITPLMKDPCAWKYVFFGDSHIYMGVNPKQIKDSVNMGFLSNTFIEDYFKLKRQLDKGVRPERLILEIDPHSFSSYNLDTLPLKYDYWYYSSFTQYDEARALTNKSSAELFVASTLPFIGKYDEFIASRTRHEQESGFLICEGNFSASLEQTSARIDKQFLGRTQIDPLLLDYYLKFIGLAAENNISITLIMMPLSYPYLDELELRNISREYFYREILGRTELITKDYKILDYHTLFADTGLFCDPDHLNAAGVAIFSSKLAEDLQTLG
jgi:hypothetical protein